MENGSFRHGSRLACWFDRGYDELMGDRPAGVRVHGMRPARTNQEWIAALSGEMGLQAEAIEDLRDLVLRAALYTLAAHLDSLQGMEERERLALAEDCAQEAVIAVLDRLSDFRAESKFTTWAYKFGVNIALTRARRERWKQVSLEALSEQGDQLEWLLPETRTGGRGSETPALKSEVASILQQVIGHELTARQRQVLKWIAFDDVPMDVVVEQLGTNRNAVYKLLHDARLKVRQHLSARGYDLNEVYELFQR